MTYLALYREWRPRYFKEIVGQEHITRTLTNAIRQERIAHAYLFSGPRGTGKTTAAKVLAKALNCEQRTEVEPCNECASCLSIDQGNAMEVLEIDAASNRGIDEIRNLRENVKLSAAKGKYKVYIIDEVHMLTTEAFNALLKTLEEPPRQVVFILATTEVQKIPLTILSRVQRFEFHRIAISNIQERLAEVCTDLQRSVDVQALQVIAQKSEGGLRDALSILDQCLVVDEHIGVDQVYQVLGMVGESFSSEIVDALAGEDYGRVMSLLAQGIEQGRDPRQILRELLEYLRQALLYLSTGQSPLVPAHLQSKLEQQSRQIGLERLLSWIDILLRGESQLRFASNARLAVELILVQTLYESTAGNNASVNKASISNTGVNIGINRPGTASSTMRNGNGINSNVSNSNVSNANSKGAPPQPDKGKEEEQMRVVKKPGEVNMDQISARWPEVLDRVWKVKKSTQAFLQESKPFALQEDVLTLQFRKGFSFHRDKVDQVENRQTVEQVLSELFGVKLTLKNIMEDEIDSAAQQIQEQALVDKATTMFGPELVVVKDE